MHPLRSAGVMGTARWKGDTGYQGRPVLGEGSGLTSLSGGGLSSRSSAAASAWLQLVELIPQLRLAGDGRISPVDAAVVRERQTRPADQSPGCRDSGTLALGLDGIELLC